MRISFLKLCLKKLQMLLRKKKFIVWTISQFKQTAGLIWCFLYW